MKKTKYAGVYEGTPTSDGRKYFYKVYTKDINGKNKQTKSKKYLTAKEAYDERCLRTLKKNNPHKKEFYLVAMDYFKIAYTKRKESTIYSYEYIYKKHLEPYFGTKDINSINNQTIRQWHLEMSKKGFKTSYLQKCHIVLSEILDFAVKNHNLEINCAKVIGNFEKTNEEKLEAKNKLEYLTYEQYQQLLKIVDDKEDFTLYNFLFYSGSRMGEAQALTWNDVNFESNEITISKTLSTKTKDQQYKITTPKNGKTRIVIMNEKLKKVMYDHYLEMKKYKDFENNWFVFGCSRFMPETTIRRHLRNYFKKINEDDSERISPHGFRHTLVTLLANEYIKQSKEKNMKVDTEKFFTMISTRTGHDVDTMKRTYMHLFPTIQDEIVDLLDNL